MPRRTIHYKMCNYFSIGVESRIGVGFDRYRTKSAFLNKLVRFCGFLFGRFSVAGFGYSHVLLFTIYTVLRPITLCPS